MATDGVPTVLPRPPMVAIGMLAAGALAYELLLMRAFSIIQWHHFAYMIISVALLGYGASGTFLALAGPRTGTPFARLLILNLAAFGLSAIGGFLLAQSVAFHAEELLWDWRAIGRLVVMYLALGLPFFFAANAIGLCLMTFRVALARLYAIDLIGAGIGALGALGLLSVMTVFRALACVAALGLACAVVAAFELRFAHRLAVASAGVLAIAVIAWLGQTLALVPSPYKALSQTLRVDGARVVAERHGPLGLVQVVENPRVPPRFAPGLSLNAAAGPGEQLALFVDGNDAGAITRDTGATQAVGFLDQLTSALPYHLRPLPRVLILGAAGGMGIAQARYAGAVGIDAVELNPQIIALLENEFADFTGGLHARPGVHLHPGDARGWLAASGPRYDLIQRHAPGGEGGLFALAESYLDTTEAIGIYLKHLEPGGYLALSQSFTLPPREAVKMFATAVLALRRTGAADPGRRLLWIRGWQTSTLLVKNGEFTAPEIAAMQDFCRTRAFDVAWYPGIAAAETNRYNLLQEPYFYQAARTLLYGDAEEFFSAYKFDVRPASDNRPYFHHFAKWSALPEILRLRGSGGLALLDAGYPVLVATLAQAVLASGLLILLPLVRLRPPAQDRADRIRRRHVVAYFGAIGLAFMFLEIACMQKFLRLLHHPLFAISVVLVALLVSAGLGSRAAARYARGRPHRQALRPAVAGIAALGLVYLLGLDYVFAWLAASPVTPRIAASILLIAPLGFCMGMPMPLGLGALAENTRAGIPLAWGVNGCASVIGAVLATLIAIHFGFTTVVASALLLYVVALIAFPTGGSLARTVVAPGPGARLTRSA